MGENNFNIDPQEHDRIQDTGYFRGKVMEKLNHLESELVKQSGIDDNIKTKLSDLPCTANKNKITYALLLIAVLFGLLGYNNFPFIMKFFGTF